MTAWEKFWLALSSMLVFTWSIKGAIAFHSTGPMWLSVASAVVVSLNVIFRAWRTA